MTQQRSPARYPTGGDYVDALQLPGLAFTDPQLRAGTVKTDDLGMPEPVSGNFASVFHVYGTAGEQWAIKCFVRPDPDRHRRYHAIAAALQTLHHRALVDFDYQVDGVMVAGVRYPLLKMRWVQAQGLMPWLETHISYPERLLGVAEQFADVVTALEKAGIAHGDLQHGNLLVTGHDELKLIDYDGMYVPEIAGLPPNEKGLVNYQHPRRGDSDYGPGLDRFSAWVIYTSLIALAARPDLWRRLRATDDDTKLLFASDDYLDPAASDAFRALRAVGPPRLVALADQLAAFTRMAPSQIPALEANPTTAVIPPKPAGPASPATDTPDWLTDHLPGTPPVSRAAPAQTTANVPVRSLSGAHLTVARIAAAGMLLCVAGVTAAAFGVAALMTVPPTVWIIAVIAAVVVIAGSYLAHPLVAARRRARHAYAAAQQELAAVQAHAQALRGTRAQMDAARTAQQQALRGQRAATVRQRDAATAHAQHVLQQTLQGIAQRRSDWSNTQQAREQKRLAEIVAEHVQRALNNAVIAKNPPRMIHATIAGTLAAHGFRTAADFTGYRTASGYGRYDRTFIRRHPSDSGTYVENVGEARAKSLLQWRESIKTRAESQAPKTLTSQQRQEVTVQVQQFHAALNAEENAAKMHARTAVEQARAVERAAQVAMDAQEQQMEAKAQDKRANLERRIVGADAAVDAARRNTEYLSDPVEHLTRLSAPAYLLAIAGVISL
ncbi:protein kinase domain-containing protein [Krasilnikovia sp. M28-CT-15]|uniref:protein kinase domain-containing protein n=1 Tax=Krasilnikovia sp. M28-CT-15 TaxID=3373540 RepID=UPI0038770D53